jgi:hypothetical protein
MANIEFLIIGAQKGGTTSLFEYLRRHPEIHMPKQKEVAFFSTERNYRRGPDWYMTSILQDAQPGAVCGEASVAYMDGTPFGDISDKEYSELAVASPHSELLEEVVPRRIKQLLPDVKLICVLRDPVARAYSHYRMGVLDRAESRSFDQAVDQLIEPSALEQARITPTITNSYIVNGEYFRVLAGFLRVFPRGQLMVIFSDDLAERPAEVLAETFGFIGVDGDFMPDNLGARYRTAAVERRIAGLDLYAWQRRFARVAPVRSIWHLLPARVRDNIDRAVGVASFRVEIWNARRSAGGDDDDEMSSSVQQRLIAHFRHDSEALAELLDMRIPWLTTWAGS